MSQASSSPGDEVPAPGGSTISLAGRSFAGLLLARGRCYKRIPSRPTSTRERTGPRRCDGPPSADTPKAAVDHRLQAPWRPRRRDAERLGRGSGSTPGRAQRRNTRRRGEASSRPRGLPTHQDEEPPCARGQHLRHRSPIARETSRSLMSQPSRPQARNPSRAPAPRLVSTRPLLPQRLPVPGAERRCPMSCTPDAEPRYPGTPARRRITTTGGTHAPRPIRRARVSRSLRSGAPNVPKNPEFILVP